MNVLGTDHLAETALAEQLENVVLLCDVLPNGRQVDLVGLEVSLVFHDYIFNYNH